MFIGAGINLSSATADFPPPVSGMIYLVDADGAYLIDADGAFLLEPI